MANFKKIISLLLALVMLSAVLTGCARTDKNADDGRLKIVATIFPQYDFARQIGGNKADVTMLLPRVWRATRLSRPLPM